MEKTHRKLITANLLDLMRLIDIKLITPFLMQERIFTEHMMEDIFSEKTLTDIKQKLLLELCTRGPTAFDKFVKILEELGNHKAVSLLKPDYVLDQSINRNKHIINVAPQLTEWGQQQSGGTDAENEGSGTCAENEGANQLSVKVATELKVGSHIYQMKSNPRGYCLIINNENFIGNIMDKREGTETDAIRLDMIFKHIGYHVILRKDQTANGMINLLKSFSGKEEHASVDSCIVAILSHGKRGVVYGTDAEKVSINEILELFDNSNCPKLANKPKMFFIQACRGENRDIGVSIAESSDAVPSNFGYSNPLSDGFSRLPTLTDMLISYSTIEGNISIRNHSLGSWYCQELATVLMKKSCDCGLIEMLQEVESNVRKRISYDGEKQSTEIVLKGWEKHLYFNPGLFE